ncbi:response regulator transcription factor [Mesobacterium sp. TK19101]|uniref:Response regulator transcription factor n=1 Tax=Mesobacterium hydrothermale TaxID=3111907 RepID=A0ABU6HH83_9RHOB|nr:response regulator transcription factor [Mesobacterium sp. TK19101]MEC3860465.1 response regulator transcription factor [Mesobacterium sp. TK19101]
MKASPKVLIADDHALSAAGLQRALDSRGFDVLPPCLSGIEAIALANAEKPDLAVLDYHMPGASGVEALFEIRRWSPGTRVAILTGQAAPGLLATLEAAGPDGLFLKSSDPDALVDGLQKVLAGETVVATGRSAEVGTLSPRELQVLRCIADGHSNPAIAEHLSISVKTVESHRASIMRKLGVNSIARLLVHAIRQGLLPT